MSIEIQHRHIVVTCKRDGRIVEVWIPADAGMGDRPDTAKPFVVAQPRRRELLPGLMPAELKEVEKI